MDIRSGVEMSRPEKDRALNDIPWEVFESNHYIPKKKRSSIDQNADFQLPLNLNTNVDSLTTEINDSEIYRNISIDEDDNKSVENESEFSAHLMSSAKSSFQGFEQATKNALESNVFENDINAKCPISGTTETLIKAKSKRTVIEKSIEMQKIEESWMEYLGLSEEKMED